MLSSTVRRSLLVAGAMALASAAGATTLVQMNIKDLATRADKVFRGTVVGIDSTTVSAGGGALPVMVYRLRVAEVFKGTFDERDGQAVVEVRMIAPAKQARAAGAVQHAELFRDLPRLEMGREYVLFTTRPSAVGLSAPVGLGQGAFTITGAGKEETSVNAFNNVGLNRGLERTVLPSSGPVSYARLAQAIRAVLNE